MVTLVLTAMLAAGPAVAQDWTFEFVSNGGTFHELAVDADGNPHVLFSNCTTPETCHEAEPGNPWLKYGSRQGGSWLFETVSSLPRGDFPSLVVDDAGGAHAAFQDSTRQMHYDYRAEAGWTQEDLVHEHLLRYRASPSLTLDSDGEPHIAYIERERIRYAHRVGPDWTDEEVTGSSLDNQRARASLLADSGDQLHIGSWLYDASAAYFTRGISGWTHELLDGDIGWKPWCVLDDNDKAHFVLHGFNGVSYATNSGGDWLEEVIDPLGDSQADDIALDGSGRPFVAYVRAELVTYSPPWLYNFSLQLAWREHGQWQGETVAAADSIPDTWASPRLEIDASGTVHLLYRDPEADELWYATRHVPTAVGPQPEPPAAHLLAVYPNPFNPVTCIAFRLDRERGIRLAVHDIAGHQVATVADGRFAAGEHTVLWTGQDHSGRNIPSGAYLVRLQLGDRIETQKLILVR